MYTASLTVTESTYRFKDIPHNTEFYNDGKFLTKKVYENGKIHIAVDYEYKVFPLEDNCECRYVDSNKTVILSTLKKGDLFIFGKEVYMLIQDANRFTECIDNSINMETKNMTEFTYNTPVIPCEYIFTFLNPFSFE